ncbi:FG-GAP repeat domain-containing protein [Streptomyces sp. NPDC060027]|uniref:FG-GAP repeat domain-containing protein n=1 Tax=Streptomyces sp. NPDC060027 TaxID=3347040 RepID=UPI0036B5CA9C
MGFIYRIARRSKGDSSVCPIAPEWEFTVPFNRNEDWTHGPCFGSRGTFFADVTGDGKADIILVNEDTVTVRRSTGADFGPSPKANEDWTHGPYLGRHGIFFADVTGDGKADAIVVNTETVTVRRAV